MSRLCLTEYILIFCALGFAGVACQTASTPPSSAVERTIETPAGSDGASGAGAAAGEQKPGLAQGPTDTTAFRDLSGYSLQLPGCIEGNCENGTGVYVYPGGDIYAGLFRNKLREGNGQINYANGDKYLGSMKNDQRHGFGSYHFANGDRYVGEFQEGRMQGIGTYRFLDGVEFKGVFGENGRLGEGTLRESDFNRNCTVENRSLYCRN